MSTVEGIIRQAEPKTSKKGNKYYRLSVEPDAGGAAQWYTYFGTLHGEPIGARAVLALKPMGDGVICDDYNILEPGQPAQTQAPSAPAPATNTHAGAPGHRDIWIFAECVYQHWIKTDAGGEFTPEDIKTMVAHSLDAAIFAHEVFQAYDESGYTSASKLIRAAFPGSPEGKAQELERKVAQSNDDANAGNGDLDDDIPF